MCGSGGFIDELREEFRARSFLLQLRSGEDKHMFVTPAVSGSVFFCRNTLFEFQFKDFGKLLI